MKWAVAMIEAAGLAILTGAGLPGATAAVTAHTILIENMRFNPATLTVHRGDRVIWINKDLVAHTATADGSMIDSRAIAANASWSSVVRHEGRLHYRCAFHPTMEGLLIVEP